MHCNEFHPKMSGQNITQKYKLSWTVLASNSLFINPSDQKYIPSLYIHLDDKSTSFFQIRVQPYLLPFQRITLKNVHGDSQRKLGQTKN